MIEFQSAHPVRGATARASSFRSPRPDFNPRTSQTPTGSRRFQSTRPVWGATLDRVQPRDLGRHFNPRAPCGARLLHCKAAWVAAYFNPRAPCGARQPARYRRTAPCNFNPRAPCGARLGQQKRAVDQQDFNPRAPCGARRLHLPNLPGVRRNFNPRAPCGARRSRAMSPDCSTRFQSTRPVWGATANLTILPRQICTKGTKEFLLGRKTHGEKEK